MSDEPFDINTAEMVEPDEMVWDEIIPNPSLNGEETVLPNGRGTSKGSERVRRLFDARNTQPKASKPPKPNLPKPRPGALVKPLTELYTTIGTMMAPFDQPCGMSIVSNAEPCAIAMDKLARDNPAVHRALAALLETSIWGAVIAAHAPILITVAMHHNPSIRQAMKPDNNEANEYG